MFMQEDKAPAHASKHQDKIFMDFGVLRLIWPGNSPDLNMIEPCWPWMKRQTTRRGAHTSRLLMMRAWQKCWGEELTQECIQSWIERIPRHVKKIIELKGGNEYREGKDENTISEIRPYQKEERREKYERAKAGFRSGDII